MARSRSERARIAIVSFKLLTGGLELVAGTALFILSEAGVHSLVDSLLGKVRTYDPNHPFVSFVQRHVPDVLSRKSTIGVALLALGVVNVVGAIGLLKHKPWAYYLILVSLVGLLPVDIHHLVTKPTVVSAVLVGVNVVVLAALLIFRKQMIEHETGEHPQAPA